MKTPIFTTAVLLAANLWAQSPPIVVDAAASPVPATKVTSATSKDSGSIVEAIKALEAAKATNAELLKKQEATSLALDELQKEADQIRVFTKRG